MMDGSTHYDAILKTLAEKFYNDLPFEERPLDHERAEVLRRDLCTLTLTAIDDPVWMLWAKVRKSKVLDGKLELCKSRAYKMTSEELAFLGEVALHIRTGGPSIRLPCRVVEQVSSWKLDSNITVRDVVDLKAPDYVWFEWPKFDSSGKDPWVYRTIGLFISRFVLLDAPHYILRSVVQQKLEGSDDGLELMRGLLQDQLNGLPGFGYQLTVVQQDDRGYRFLHPMFGHSQDESLVSMLALLKEVSDRDKHKFKNVEQVWGNVAARLLLFAANKGLLSSGEHVIEDGSELSKFASRMHTFYSERAGPTRRIALRPNYRFRSKPFSVIPAE